MGTPLAAMMTDTKDAFVKASRARMLGYVQELDRALDGMAMAAEGNGQGDHLGDLSNQGSHLS